MKELIKPVKYEKIATKLRNLIGLTETELEKALSGRNVKYRVGKDGFEAVEFQGISVIHNIDENKAKEMKLSDMAQGFKNLLMDAGLEHMIAFVDLKSFHATTFDLINKPETRNTFANPVKNSVGYIYEDVRKEVEVATFQFLKHGDDKGYNAPHLKAKVKITGIGMFAPNVVKLNLAMINEEDKEKFGEFRERLHQYLVDQVGGGYALIREKIGKLSSHITIGYTMNSVSEEQIEQFIEILKIMNREFQDNGKYAGIEFDLTQGEVTLFTDMDHYIPVSEYA